MRKRFIPCLPRTKRMNNFYCLFKLVFCKGSKLFVFSQDKTKLICLLFHKEEWVICLKNNKRGDKIGKRKDISRKTNPS